MIRELFVAASITGTAVGLAPAVIADPGPWDGDVPGILLPLPQDIAGGGTIDLSRIRFAEAAAFGHRHARVSASLMSQVDQGLRRLLGL